MAEAIVLETLSDVLEFDRTSGRLTSYKRKSAPDLEFIAQGRSDSACIIQYLDSQNKYRQISSSTNSKIRIVIKTILEREHGETTYLEIHIDQFGELNVEVVIRVRASKTDQFVYWSCFLNNEADLIITDIQFPIIIVPYQLGGRQGSEALVWPIKSGVLFEQPRPHNFKPDCLESWQISPQNNAAYHYPGYIIAQFLAYYNNQGGILVSCSDSMGFVKLIQPVHHRQGLRLGIAHVGDWPRKGKRTLEYNVVTTSFKGDWYSAAEIYRNMSIMYSWARTAIHERNDIPDWLLDSPPHIILRIQGQLDEGPAEPNHDFLPYEKCIPLLEMLSQKVESALVPIIMAWERPGPWTYPDSFPPAGGLESLANFSELARKNGWHIGTYCNGTRWVTAHLWSGYDGEEYLNKEKGLSSICLTSKGELWKDNWDSSWRTSYTCCLGTSLTRETAQSFVQKLISLGLDWIQFLDQNNACVTFPCFAANHEHPPVPGRWMTEKMHILLDIFSELAKDEFKKSGGKRRIVFSVEGPVNEYYLPYLHICDIRVVPPGHHFYAFDLGGTYIPLFHFLYHEFVLIQGSVGTGPDPFNLQIKNAFNCVIGEIPGAVMTGDGTLLNRDCDGWATWDRNIDKNENALEMLRNATALRRKIARDFLVYGRMLHPTEIRENSTISWNYNSSYHQIPAIFHCAWQAPDGRFGLVVANWTEDEQKGIFNEPRLGRVVTVHVSSARRIISHTYPNSETLNISLPPLSCALLESQ